MSNEAGGNGGGEAETSLRNPPTPKPAGPENRGGSMKRIGLVFALTMMFLLVGCEANPVGPNQGVQQVDRTITETCDYPPDGCDGWLW